MRMTTPSRPCPPRQGPGWRAAGVALALWLAGTASALTLRGQTTDGDTVDIASLRGQVVLLFFWSTACPVCLDKLPELRRNLAGWTGQPFVVVAVNQDPDRQAHDAYMRLRRQLVPASPQWKDLWRGNAAHRDDVGPLPGHVPVTVLLDRAGQVRLRVEGRIAPGLWDDVAELVLH